MEQINLSLHDRAEKPEAFIFDIHGVLLNNAGNFRRFLTRQAEKDSRINLDWEGDIFPVLNGLLYKNCPQCSFAPCTVYPIDSEVYPAGQAHIFKSLYTGELSYEAVKVGITQMLTHHVTCAPSVRIILDYLAEFLTKPELLAQYASENEKGAQLIEHIYATYGPEKLFILSNVHPDLYEAYKKRFPHIFSLVPREHVVMSGEVGIFKPSENLFTLIPERYNYHPAECVMIDDRSKNCETARSIGMSAVHFIDDIVDLYTYVGLPYISNRAETQKL